MSQTQDLETLAVLAEIAMLESWFDHELRCESPHQKSTHGITDSGCTVVATHRIVGHEGAFLLCQPRADYKIKEQADGVVCTCGKRASECWRVTPL